MDGSKRRIQQQAWYFGLCSKDMIEPLLIKHNKGDFTVRAVQKGEKTWLALNVRNENSVDNFKLVFTPEQKFMLLAAKTENKQFDNVMDLIEYYREHPLPSKVRLRYGVIRPSWLLPPSFVNYDKQNIMGSGNFSNVYRGTVAKEQGTVECAIKVLVFNDKGMSESNGIRQFLAETKFQASYDHENVVQMFGVVLDCPPIMMIMELCHGGSLDKHLQQRGTRITPFEKQLYLLEAAFGMRYLHSRGCIHRDLAARNCLIGDDGRIKISDFGLSLFSPDGATLTAKMEMVPLRWMAPECIRREMSFSFKTDVWAYGVLMFEVFSNGSKPFADYVTDEDDTRMLKAIKKAEMPPAPEGMPLAMETLLKKEIWQKDDTLRPDFIAVTKTLCKALKEETPLPLDHLILNELPKVRREDYPDFDWDEDKELEKVKKKELEKLEEKKRKQEEARKKKAERRASMKKNATRTTSIVKTVRAPSFLDAAKKEKSLSNDCSSEQPNLKDEEEGKQKTWLNVIGKLKKKTKSPSSFERSKLI